MYRLAIIQNESEMTRYGWADIRPMLASMQNYQTTLFTADNLSDFFAELPLGRYDGIVIATNACNDQTVRDLIQEEDNQKKLNDFIRKGGGLFVSLQMRLSDLPQYGFLPSPFDAALITRKEFGEEGHLVFPAEQEKHILYKYPHNVKSEDVVRQCLHNEFVKSLYRAYLRPIEDGIYDVVLIDDKYGDFRPLLLCSRANNEGRVVLASIPLDWQAHQQLLENVIHFVVEGQPDLAVIEKMGETVFDFQYLVENLAVTKVPFSRYVQSKLDFDKINFDIHDTIILDPGWTYEDLVNSNYSQSALRMSPTTRLFFFSQTRDNKPIVSYVGGLRNVDVLLPSTITWLKASYKDGRWGGSFWHTFDVIENLIELGIDLKEYSEEILKGISSHVVDGSYDEVMGATCAMLKILKIFKGIEDPQFKSTLKWIQKRYPEASLYEQAAAIDTLNEVGLPFAENVLVDFRAKSMQLLPALNDDLRLYRFAKTLISSNYIDDGLRICMKLASYQSEEGAWLNIARTSSILLLLIRIQRLVNTPPKNMDEMIFRGITYLKSTYNVNTGNWNNDVAATSKALRAIVEFEQRVSYPIDELVQTLQRSERNTREYRTIATAAAENSRLQKERASLTLDLISEKKTRKISTTLAITLALVSTPVFTILLLMLFHSIKTDNITTFIDYFRVFIKDWVLEISASLIAIPLIILYIILRSFGSIPMLKIIPEEWENWILRKKQS